jgi:adenylate cyclase
VVVDILPASRDDITGMEGVAFAEVARVLGEGIAVADLETWQVLFENDSFTRWFPLADGGAETLTTRVTGLDTSRVESRTRSGRAYSFETESHAAGRAVPIEVSIRRLPDPPDTRIVVECRDISKQKQAEYMLESYSQLSEKNARELQREKDRAERLLLNIMPKSVYEEMKEYGTVTPQLFPSASILMLDFVGSTDMAISRDPAALITELNDIFTVFDRITDMFGCERIRTVGDSYMAVAGLPDANPEHAQNAARAALRMMRYIERRNVSHAEEWQCRIGINSGPVIGSLVGVQKYVYDIFGPGVNMAARMETLSEPMKITISEDTYHLIKDDFACVERGEFEVKGFGTNTLYFLERELVRGR